MRTKASVAVMLCSLLFARCQGGGSLAAISAPPPNPPQAAYPAPPGNGTGTSPAVSGSLLFGPSSGKITHIIIIFQENRTPDNLFHGLPGADIAASGLNSRGQMVPLVPVSLAAPFEIDHSHRAFLASYNAGRMNGFNTVQVLCKLGYCRGATQYGYVPPSEVAPYFTMAEQYTFADRMFQTNQGPSFPAHQFIISGTSTNQRGSSLLAAENVTYAGIEGNCDGSTQSRVPMIDPTGSESISVWPCFEHATLTDLLDAKGISWRYYDSSRSNLWAAPDAIAHIRRGPDWANVVSPGSAVLQDIIAGKLPGVSWVIPTPAASDHALSTDGSGPDWVASIVNSVGNSPYWNSTAIFVTWDDWGGWYDHVRPTMHNSYELGFRVPLIVISPYARSGYVSHVQHEFGSILHFSEETFGLPTIGYTDARSDDLADCFNFSQAPLAFRTIPVGVRLLSTTLIPPPDAPPDDDF